MDNRPGGARVDSGNQIRVGDKAMRDQLTYGVGAPVVATG